MCANQNPFHVSIRCSPINSHFLGNEIIFRALTRHHIRTNRRKRRHRDEQKKETAIEISSTWFIWWEKFVSIDWSLFLHKSQTNNNNSNSEKIINSVAKLEMWEIRDKQDGRAKEKETAKEEKKIEIFSVRLFVSTIGVKRENNLIATTTATMMATASLSHMLHNCKMCLFCTEFIERRLHIDDLSSIWCADFVSALKMHKTNTTFVPSLVARRSFVLHYSNRRIDTQRTHNVAIGKLCANAMQPEWKKKRRRNRLNWERHNKHAQAHTKERCKTFDFILLHILWLMILYECVLPSRIIAVNQKLNWNEKKWEKNEWKKLSNVSKQCRFHVLIKLLVSFKGNANWTELSKKEENIVRSSNAHNNYC